MEWKLFACVNLLGLFSALVCFAGCRGLQYNDTNTTAVSGPYCFSCEKVDFPSRCRHVELCQEQEVCYTEKYSDPQLGVVYRLGCRPETQCSPHLSPGTCLECCNISHCNSVHCDKEAATHNQCYTCDNLMHPTYCEIVEPCDTQHEKCFVEKAVTDALQIRYFVGCMKKDLCEIAKSFGLDKRHRREDVIAQLCVHCCDGQKCNRLTCD